jgi:SAM-dependent methyltransferase
MRSVAKVIGPARLSQIGRRLRSLPGASRLVDRADRHRSERLERANDAPELAKSRWRTTAPGPELTWGKELTGDAFVDRAVAHHAFGPDRTVLEVGPGYGRILRTCLERSVPFHRWVGLDLSAENVRHLSREFPDPRIEFVEGDAESARWDTPVDTVLSSLTFKHIYPSFELALRNLAGQLSERGLVLFDLIEGSRRYFHWDEITYVREYSREEVGELLARAPLELVGFDTVAHDREHVRLLVIAAATSDRLDRDPSG